MKFLIGYVVAVAQIFNFAFTVPISENDHSKEIFGEIPPATNEQILQEAANDFWWKSGEEQLKKLLKDETQKLTHEAKNVIIFIGDGMGLSTTTASRIYKGQHHLKKIGEEHILHYEKFPNVGLVKTYNVDSQVPDSAGTATALFTGVKTRRKILGLDLKCSVLKFEKEVYEASKLESLMTWAQAAGKDTGIVTNTRITHATPAATYARINNRDWECDSKIPEEYRHSLNDIAKQLVLEEPGKSFKVIMGGGQQALGYLNNAIPKDCSRLDGLNLTDIWLNNHNDTDAVFAVNANDLNQVNDDTQFLLGLFSPSHCPFELLRDEDTPSLTDMTRTALRILKKNKNGFVLLVEGGLIDHGHHKNFARIALEEAAEFDNAISLAVNETEDDTLLLVTADHSHSFTINGYAKRGNDIFGYTKEEQDRHFYSTLSYGNGPGFNYHYTPNDVSSSSAPWRDVSTDENRLTSAKYRSPATFYLDDETHGGEDVAIYARGPSSHLIRGVIEQNYIAHIVSYAACIGPHAKVNVHCSNSTSSASATNVAIGYSVVVGLLLLSELF